MFYVLAHELAKEQRQNFGDDITAVLRLARKRKFVAAEEKCIVEESELHRYLRRLMENDVQRSVSVKFYVCTFRLVFLWCWMHLVSVLAVCVGCRISTRASFDYCIYSHYSSKSRATLDRFLPQKSGGRFVWVKSYLASRRAVNKQRL